MRTLLRRQFPANTEEYREFINSWVPNLTHRGRYVSHLRGLTRRELATELRTEQGIKWRISGNKQGEKQPVSWPPNASAHEPQLAKSNFQDVIATPEPNPPSTKMVCALT